MTATLPMPTGPRSRAFHSGADDPYPSAEALATSLGGRRNGRAYKARCPAHDDAEPSLDITEKDGQTVFICRAGCEQAAVLAALRNRGLWPDARASNGIHAPKRRIVATYDYRDVHGDLVFQVVRYEPKDFRQRRPDSKGGWVWNMEGVPRLIYQLDKLTERIIEGPIFVVEGEKDADALWAIGIAATCNVGGAGKWREEDSAHLEGADVIVLPDNDKPGQKHAADVVLSLKSIAKRVRVVDLPGLPPKGDVSDWLAAGGTADMLAALADAAREWRSEDAAPAAPIIRDIDLHELMDMDIKPREMVLGPAIPEKGLVMLHAVRGIGKTHVGLGISYAVATGGEFLRWKAPRPRKVLYIDGEMPAGSLQERLRWIMGGKRPDKGMLRFLVVDLLEEGLGNLGNPDTQQTLEPFLQGVNLVVLDNLSSLTAVLRDNDAESWGTIQDWLLRLRRRGIAVLIIHHAGKGGDQRGTSRREDVLDTSISLRRPANYKPEEGARFEVHYTKGRGIRGDDAKPFEARLRVEGLRAVWDISDVENATHERVRELLDMGMSIRDIADEAGVPRSTVHRIKQKLEKEAPEGVPTPSPHWDRDN